MPSSGLRCGARQQTENQQLGGCRPSPMFRLHVALFRRSSAHIALHMPTFRSPKDERLRRGYHQSVLEDENEADNEAYNYRIKLMKNVVRAAITLSLEVSRANQPMHVKCTRRVGWVKLGWYVRCRCRDQV